MNEKVADNVALGVAAGGVAAPVWWDQVWAVMPSSATLYAAVSIGFMIFRMLDMIGLLPERKKKHNETE